MKPTQRKPSISPAERRDTLAKARRAKIVRMLVAAAYAYAALRPVPLPEPETTVIVNHTAVGLGVFCKQAKADHAAMGKPLTGDLADACL